MAESSGMIRRGARQPHAPTDKDRDRVSLKSESKHTAEPIIPTIEDYSCSSDDPL